MADTQEDPWETVSHLLETGDSQGLEQFLLSLTPVETARLVARLRGAERRRLFELVSPTAAAGVLQDLPDAQAAVALSTVEPTRAASIVEELPSAERADILADAPDRTAESILTRMSPDKSKETRQLLSYSPATAGGLMVTEYLTYSVEQTVQEAVEDLRSHSTAYTRYGVQYVYLTSPGGRLEGVLKMRDLLFAPPTAGLYQIMLRDPVTVRETATIEALYAVFQEHPYLGVPVVDRQGRLLGVVPREKIHEYVAQNAPRQFLAFTGISGGEELRSAPLGQRLSHRLPWLAIKLVLGLVAASIIAARLRTIAGALILAAFLPVVSEVSRGAGLQAAAVSIRELSLGLVRPTEVLRVLWRELVVGLLLSVLLGALLAGTAILWQGNSRLGLVVGAALALNTLIGLATGGTLPLLLRRLGMTPAAASAPLLSAAVDVSGFLLVLELAGRFLAPGP